MTRAPAITTARLRLRGHVLSDMDAFEAFHATSRAAFVGRPENRTHLWYGFASEVGSWDLMGHGGWAIEDRDGQLIGQVAITRPPHFPETEIGWTLLDHAEGRGYAFEAASAALTWAWDNEFETLVSYIHPENARSIALAERLGAAHDPNAALPDGETADETLVYRHSPDTDGSPEAYA
ncbi:GNAT family N-acetyltransferase [Aestuariicoccus sp. MJ-SS9]|uniref:GNAT family N-acetyltransferase n=1 Tax=Aestuariicoccus sp. MJ-SS9 TaxID=3079855 RepID=UPI0029094BF5|nr:GNAT family N-acetyltransferase [Aestuariicoccus sp. MJ-SS9]MDU8912935.1 GNAT family N-acetyltransferase [Aestuariicoccus sp. MJ-SS9]